MNNFQTPQSYMAEQGSRGIWGETVASPQSPVWISHPDSFSRARRFLCLHMNTQTQTTKLCPLTTTSKNHHWPSLGGRSAHSGCGLFLENRPDKETWAGTAKQCQSHLERYSRVLVQRSGLEWWASSLVGLVEPSLHGEVHTTEWRPGQGPFAV